jgi:hypothetical protein
MPENISALSADELKELSAAVRAYAKGIVEATPAAAPDDIAEATTMYQSVLAERKLRGAAEESRQALASSLDEDDEDETEDEAEEAEEATEAAAEVAEPAAVVASVKPKVRRSTIEKPAENTGEGVISMLTAPDVPGMAGGQVLPTFKDAARAIDARLRAYSPSNTQGRRSPLPVRGDHTFAVEPGRTAVRHGAVVFKREFPEELRIHEGDTGRAFSVAKFAAKESRLPGGSLIESAALQIKKGRAITAAVGWCAPSEVIYSLCDLASLDGLLDLPEIQAPRGGYQLPANGGPDFSIVWDGIGDAGDVILTEYDVENGAVKECFEIPCPDFTDVRLDVAYLCLTGSLLQRRGYPEVVEWFSQESMKALAHKVNASVIAKIVAASGAATVIPADASGDDAASALLSAVDLAIEDSKYRNRMSRGVTLEVVLPYWALTQIRAALSRRYGVAMLDVTDEMIFRWFAARKAMVRLVYDWQDAYTGLMGGPGGSSPLTALPTTVQFLVYPAGTWTKIVQDVVNLDTIYDNALLTTNQYTAIFAEDGFNVIQTCPESRLYTVTVDPSGVVGCCA